MNARATDPGERRLEEAQARVARLAEIHGTDELVARIAKGFGWDRWPDETLKPESQIRRGVLAFLGLSEGRSGQRATFMSKTKAGELHGLLDDVEANGLAERAGADRGVDDA